MKKWIKKIGGMTLGLSILFSSTGAVQAADVQYGMTGAMALGAVHMQSATETPMPTVATIAEYKAAEAAPVAAEPTVPTIAGKEYAKEMNIVATAYGPGNIMPQWGGLTKMGTKVRQGVVSVDPNVIPLGSKVFITGYNKTPLLPAGGFVATAEDTGGAIKGNRIDIYLNGTQQQLLNFGKQNVKVFVLK